MGCGSPSAVIDFKKTEDVIESKRKVIEGIEAGNSAPTDEQKMLIVRYNIETYEQIDTLTKELKIKSTKETRKKLESLVAAFNDLIARWKAISKEEEEEVQLRLANENA